MDNIFLVLAGISILFVILFLIKQFLNKRLKDKFCVICGSVVLTWAVLLVLYYLNIFKDIIIIAILIGESSLGIFYFVESKVKEQLKFFRLPFILTLIMLAYYLLTFSKDILPSLIFLLVLWAVFGLVYSYKNHKNINNFINKIIACCKEW